MAPRPPPAEQESPRRLIALSASDHPDHIGHLPTSLTSFVGRAEEIAAVVDMLRRPEIRLLTVTGPGGVGKTRLAIEAAAALRSTFPDGIWFVPLASIRDPALVLPTIAGPFGVTEGGGPPLLERLIDRLQTRRALLVLDNFEQVADTAPLLPRLLTACPRVRALVTSREVLRVSGEHDVLLSPLAAPNPAHGEPGNPVLDAPAARLFVERLRTLDPTFAPTPGDAAAIAAICHHLDGLPLAIELAAARGNLLRPPALLARLEQRLPLLTGGPRDAPARLRTMRDAIRWSYDLLEEDEQRLFRSLALFAGGVTIAAAAMVCGARDDVALLERIGSLVDKSLLQRDAHGEDAREARCAMLETVREFGLEQLAASDSEQTVRRRHAEWCQTFAEQFWAAIIRGPVAPEQLRRMATEHDNLRAALSWLREREEGEAFLRLAATAWPFWLFGNHLSEGRAWLEQALAAAPNAPPALRAQALRGFGLLARPLGNDTRAVDCLEESLTLARSVDDPAGLARSLHMLAMTVMGRGDYQRARSLWYEALARFQSLPDGVKWAALVQHHLGLVAYGEEDLDQAASQLEDARILHHKGNDRRGVASSLIASALVAREHGDVARSAAMYRESLTLWEELGIQEGLAAWLAGVATLAVARDRLVQAARLFGAAARLAEQVGVTFHLPERAAYDRAQFTIRGEIGETRFQTAHAEGRELTQDQAVAEALTLLSAWDAETIAASLPTEQNDFELTPRERDVLQLLATGSTDREIAAALFVSPRTIQTHVANIRKKLDAGSRTEAAALAFRHDLV